MNQFWTIGVLHEPKKKTGCTWHALYLYPDGDLLALPIGNFWLLNVSRDLLSYETKVSVVATLKKQSLGTVLVFRSVIQKYNVTFNHIGPDSRSNCACVTIGYTAQLLTCPALRMLLIQEHRNADCSLKSAWHKALMPRIS